MNEENQLIADDASFLRFYPKPNRQERVLEQCYKVDHDGPLLMEILTFQDLSAELIIASERGAVIYHGSFEWVIGTLNRVLWKWKGPAHGIPIHSFWVELVGVLSVIWFLDRFWEFHGIKPINKPTLWIGTDSLSLLDRI